mgnify:CR=1 FL=1
MADDYFRILSLDGGGAKGFYTLGVLHEIERMVGGPLCDRFDLIYGTSTGSLGPCLRSEEAWRRYMSFTPNMS